MLLIATKEHNKDNLAGSGRGDTAITNKVDTNLSVEVPPCRPQPLEDKLATRGSDWISREAARSHLYAENPLVQTRTL